MKAEELMDIVYPILAGLYLCYIFLKIFFFFTVRRTGIVLADAFLFITDFMVLLTLALFTGQNPSFDINTYRYVVVYERMLMSIALFICIVVTTRQIWCVIKRG